ncbi:hypothetical protein ACTI_02390 [Actinoplanes sp. OR16]|uniref:hypothetical protein n=1 Tax=Actinoplanes sp. OR16 TaxID=946334 RepID=UPI000F6E5CEA|nr:hypothetical protein [Actinoplanes sp. OR16]BBH63554.1 hypothetical protein ACTI_02390 [Actinoplanes sp. OR16]
MLFDFFAMRVRIETLRKGRHQVVVNGDDRGAHSLRRLTLTSSSAWQWPADEDTCHRHGEMLRGLRGPVSRFRQAATIEDVVGALTALCLAAQPEARDLLLPARHRIHLRRADLDGIVPDLPADVHVVLDFAFEDYWDQLTCVLKVSVSTHPPGPVDEPSHGDAGQDWVDLFTTVRDRIEAWFADQGLYRTDFRIQGREYRLPTVWVGELNDPEADAGDYLSGSLDVLNGLAARTLRIGDVRDCVITPSVLNGQMLALRRADALKLDEPVRQPSYLLVPERPAASDPDGRQLWELEETLVDALVSLEGQAADRLWRIEADIDVWDHQLEVYDQVAERGLVLWDALSTHLPVRRGRQLERVHRSVELIHQILLQGVADLARMETRTQDCAAQVTTARSDLLAEFDSLITEFHTAPTGLRTALALTGVVGEVEVSAEHVVRKAARVKAKYDHLLGAMSHAFDERRVRESDVLQRASGKVGFALAFIGVITLFDATVQMKPETLESGTYLWPGEGWLSGLGFVLSVLAGLGFLGLVCWVAFSAKEEGPLGSRNFFRRIYNGDGRGDHGMWKFLRDSSSDELNKVAGDDTAWRSRDDQLSARFAELWDRIGRVDPSRHTENGRWNVATDIHRLAGLIEQWGLWTLLVTERPFGRLARYQLARLTLLYRTATRLPGTFLTGAPASVVSADDCRRSLQRLGMTWDEAAEVIDALTAEVAAGRVRTAQDVLTVLDRWQVHADTDGGMIVGEVKEARAA